MQKYDENIKKLLNFALKASNDIALLLQKDEFDAKDLQKVSDIYDKRDNLLDKIKEKMQSPRGERFIEENPEYWDQTIKALLTLDNENIEVLKRRTDEAGERVRNLYKNKSLLIYSK